MTPSLPEGTKSEAFPAVVTATTLLLLDAAEKKPPGSGVMGDALRNEIFFRKPESDARWNERRLPGGQPSHEAQDRREPPEARPGPGPDGKAQFNPRLMSSGSIFGSRPRKSTNIFM